MQTVNAIMLLLGCSHDVQVCEPAELDQPHYENVAQCEGDIPAQRHFAEGYPLVVVKCIAVDNLPGNEAVRIQWHFDKSGVLIANANPVEELKTPETATVIQIAAHTRATQQATTN